MKSLLKNFGWPISAGILFACLIIRVFPQYFSEAKHVFSSQPIRQQASYADAVDAAAASVVSIYTSRSARKGGLMRDPFFKNYADNNAPRQRRIERSLGSGVIASKNGYILTNHHVIAGADEILVSLLDGRESLASLVGSDPETDLAVLKIKMPDLSPISFGLPDQARVGDVVLALGNPFGFGHTVTQGIISAKGRYGLALNTYENYLQTDADINPGNSGGALIDVYGRLLGINSAIWSKSGGSQGIGLAVPSDTAQQVMSEIISKGMVIRGWLGIEIRHTNNDAKGNTISAVYSNSPAERAGLKPGDTLSKINDIPAINGRMGMMQVALLEPGQVIPIEVIRNGSPLKLQVTVGKRPNQIP